MCIQVEIKKNVYRILQIDEHRKKNLHKFHDFTQKI